MANHTKEDVARVIEYASAPGIKPVTAEMTHMLTAYAERIGADEGVVTDEVVEIAVRAFRKAYATDGERSLSSITSDAMRTTLLSVWPNPPAQAAQVDPAAKPHTLADFVHAPDAERVQIGQQVAARVDEMMAEPVAQGESAWLERLKDPATVHALMLRGVIAIPSVRSMVDLRGEVPNGEDVQLLRIAELQEQLAAQPRAVPDGITALINAHAELLESNPYCYFELAYTRQTEWMAWLCSKPAEDDPDRKILACGQGNTPNEACMQALAMLAAATSPGESA